MPGKYDNVKLGSAFFDKRSKLLPCQKERIYQMYNVEQGFSQRQLAKMFGVSRRTIQFTIDPSKLDANKERRQERGGSKIYYDREKHTKAMKKHRHHKKETLSKLEL